MLFLDLFKEPPYAEPIKDEGEVKKTYKHYRWRMFYACFVGYVVFHFIKKNFWKNALHIGSGLGISALFLSTIIPKVQYWITKVRTGSEEFPGTKDIK